MNGHPAKGRVAAKAHITALLIALFAGPVASEDATEPPAALSRATIETLTPGQALESVLATLSRAGYRIAYSTAVVRPEMTLVAKPAATTIEELLTEILAPWRLAATRASNGDWLIVRSGYGSGSMGPAQGRRDIATPVGPGEIPLGEIDVTASRYGLADVAPSSGTILSRDEVRATPHLTDDAVRLLNALPGVAGGDISAQLNVRGGRRDEVLLLIDGAEIRDPFHIREVSGAISVVDTNLVESMNFITGGMTADMGNRMSGMVDIRTLRPRADDEARHALGISFINAFARTQGTFSDGRGHWLASARRGYLDLVMRRIQDDDEEFTPRYQDAFAKLAYDIGPDTSLAGHVLLGSDELTFLQDDGARRSGGDAQTGSAWLTLRHDWSDELSTTTTLSSGRTDRGRQATDDRPEDIVAVLQDRAEFDFTTLRQDWIWQPHENHLMKWGVSGERERGDYDYRRESMITDPVLVGDQPVDTSQTVVLDTDLEAFGAYGAYRTGIVRNFAAEVGVRWDRYRYAVAVFSRTSPRLNLVFAPTPRSEFRAAYGIIHQPQSSYALQVEDGISTFFAPERVEQITIGFQQQLGASSSLRFDVYRKRYSDLRPLFANLFDAYELIPEAEPDRVRVDADRARVRGAEVTLRGAIGAHVSGSIGYAWSQAEENDGAWRPRFWDQRHAASLRLQWEGDKWRASLSGIYHSGWPTTEVSAVEVPQPDGSTRIQPVLGARNGERLGSFLRLDLRASREVRLEGGVLTWYLEIFSLLNRDNPCCIEDFDLVPRPGGGYSTRPNFDYWLPLLPSFGVQYEF